MNARTRAKRWLRLCALGLIALCLVAAFHHRVFFGRQTFALSGTLGVVPAENGIRRVVHDPYASSGQFEPWLTHQFREEGRHNETPRWNPWQGLGAPFLANAQTAVYHPVRWLQKVVSPAHAFDIAILVHIATAALGMWLLLRTLGLEHLSAAVGAIAFSCSGYMLFFVNMVHLGAEALLPWHILGIEILWRGRRLTGAATFAASFALSHYAGFPEATALCALVAVVWLLARVLHQLGPRAAWLWIAGGVLIVGCIWFTCGSETPNDQRIWRGNATSIALLIWITALGCVPRTVRKSCLTLGCALLAGTLLAAPVLLPFLEFVSRAQHLHAAERWVGSTHFDIATSIGLLFPNLEHYGTGMNHGYAYDEPPYLGALVVGLGLVAPCLIRTNHPARYAALLFFVLALATTAKLFALVPLQWLGDLPPLREIILRKYLGLAVAFTWAGAAACGLAALRHAATARSVFLLLGAVLSVGLCIHITSESAANEWQRWLFAVPSLVCAGWLLVAVLSIVFSRHASRNAISWRLAALTALLLFGALCELYLYAPRERATRDLALADPPGLEAWLPRLRGERVLAANGVLPPNLATRYEIQDVRFLDALVEEGLYRYFDARFDLRWRDRWDGPEMGDGLPPLDDLDHLGVRWLLAPRAWLPMLENKRIHLGVAAGGAGAMRIATGLERGLHLMPGAKLYAGPIDVPRGSASHVLFRGKVEGEMPSLIVHRLGEQATAFRTSPISLEELRNRYGRAPQAERAPIGFGRQQGRLPASRFEDHPVLISFQISIDGRALTSARLDITEARWDDGPLSADAFRRAQRFSADLVPDAQGQRPAQDLVAPNRLWLPPSAAPAFGAHLFVDYAFPASVSGASRLSLEVEAVPVLDTVPAPEWKRTPEGLTLDLADLRGESIYLEMELGQETHWRIEEALLEGEAPHLVVHQREPIVVAENRGALPTAYLSHDVTVVKASELAERLRQPTFHPRREVWVSGPDARELIDRNPLPERGVRIARPRADTLILDFEARGPGLLVVLEPFDPNWKVRIDGRPAALVPVFGAFRGVYVDDGDRHIVMQYRPDSWMWGLVIASATAGLLLLYLLQAATQSCRRRAALIAPTPTPSSTS